MCARVVCASARAPAPVPAGERAAGGGRTFVRGEAGRAAAADEGEVVAAEEHLAVAHAALVELAAAALLERLCIVHAEAVLHPAHKAACEG